jgi:hypothetical protein
MWDNSFGGARAILILCSAEQLVMVGKRDEKTIIPFSFFSTPVFFFLYAYSFTVLFSSLHLADALLAFIPCTRQTPSPPLHSTPMASATCL